MVKLKSTELARHVSLEGMQMLGGYGYATEYGMESMLRSTVVSTVYGGPSRSVSNSGMAQVFHLPGLEAETSARGR